MQRSGRGTPAPTAPAETGGGVPDPVRGKIESETGADLSSVTVDAGADGAALADAHDARAVAVGQQIHVGDGERLDGAEGEKLLAHEVAHTLQARNTSQASPRAAAKLHTTTAPDSAAEIEADRFADAITSGQTPAPVVESLHADAARTPKSHHKKKTKTAAPDPSVDAQAAPLLASPEELVFEPTALGKDSPLQTVTITNNGTEPVTIENITAGAAEAIFPTYTSSGLEGAIDAGASVELQFGFSPKKEGPAKTLYHVVTDGGITSVILRLEGRGFSDQRSEAPPDETDHDKKHDKKDDKTVAIGPIGGTAEVKSDFDWHDLLPWNNDPVLKPVVDELKSGPYDVGLLKGFNDGFEEARTDLANSVVDILKIVGRVLAGGGMGVAWDLAKTLEGILDPSFLSNLKKWFVDGWTNADDYTRGHFRGRVAGYLTLQVVIDVITDGAMAEIEATGAFAELITALKGTGGLEEVTEFGSGVTRADEAAETAANAAAHAPAEAPAADVAVPEVDTAPATAPAEPETATSPDSDAATPDAFEQEQSESQGPGAAHIYDENFSANRVYEGSAKHTGKARRVGGRSVGKEPTNGPAALDFSFQVDNNSPRRIGVDPSNNEFVVFDRTGNLVRDKKVVGGIYHGHVRTWEDLDKDMQDVLKQMKLVDKRGNISISGQWDDSP